MPILPFLIEICPYHPPSTPVTPEDSLDLTIEEAVWEADHEALQDTNVFMDHYKRPIYTINLSERHEIVAKES